MSDRGRFIDPDATLVASKETHFDTTYECGCYEYGVGDDDG